MRKISYTISLEDFKTRYPLTYPSLDNGEISYIQVTDTSDYGNANYNMIPLGIDESICGPYSGFTKEMGDTYVGKVIGYYTLKGWYSDFLDYYSLLNSNECHGPYGNAVEYHEANGNMMADSSVYSDMDSTFAVRGGDKFYRWLTTYYFVSLDFMDEYRMISEEGMDMPLGISEWLSCVNSLPNRVVYYPDACRMYGMMSKLKESAYCCDIKEYNSYGGDTMVSVLSHWIDRQRLSIGKINSKVNGMKSELIPYISINIPLGRKVEDLGNLVPFAKDFVPGREYKVGEVCKYVDDIYILTSGNGYIKDTETGLIRFDDEAWESYSKKHIGDSAEKTHSDKPLSGRTSSSLYLFERTKQTFDNLGNSLDGYFEPSTGSKFTQPSEGTMLDLKYEIGKINGMETVGTYDGVTYYTGDVLYGIEFYYKTYNGDKIEESVVYCNEGQTAVDMIEILKNSYKGISFSDVICADFIYYKNTLYSIDGDDSKIVLKKDENGNTTGVKCIDHCKLYERTASYWLSETENYPIRYYEVVKDVETLYSEDIGMNVNVDMCDWFLYPSVYDNVTAVASPSIRLDELLGYSVGETVENNIYIDRGYAMATDKHLRIGEVDSLEAIEKYGNGTFRLINLEEETL